MERYEYRNFKIEITKSKKWSYRNSEMGDLFRWDITHMGYRLESGGKDYESEAECKKDAEQTVDKLCSGGF